MSERYVLGPGLVDKLRETVRTVDGMKPPPEPPTRLTFDEPSGPIRPIRIGTFGTSSWNINASNTVTLTNVGVTGYTVLVTNLFGGLGTATTSRACAVAKDGTAWYLIQAVCGS